ncbi:MAG: L-rhamnose/proton symporter RhaT [bacterium]
MNPALGIFYHALGGFASGSFYIPFKRVRNWAWEVYWLVNGLFAWILAPWFIAYLTVPNLSSLLKQVPFSELMWPTLFGVLWGIGGLTFGLTMRYLGMSLGYAMALGLTAAFGTLIPPIYLGQFSLIVSRTSGFVTLGGILICLIGIAVMGRAGILKDRELSEEQKMKQIKEFNLKKGIWVAVLAGVMSACFAFGIAAGKPVAELAIDKGTPKLFSNNPVFIFILLGGFTTNFIWCMYLSIKNRTIGDYLKKQDTPIINNYFFSALAGLTWYFQFMFYGMGTTKMGAYDFASWSIHMAFIIAFSNMWGLILKEWKGSSRATIRTIFLGLFILVISTIVIGIGNYIQTFE